MSLRAIVQAVGGDLSANGTQALIPAPGHSAKDRSVSLTLKPDGRVLMHVHNPDTPWTAVADWLRRKGLIEKAPNEKQFRLTSAAGGPGPRAVARAPEPTSREKVEVARRIWAAGVPIAGTLAARHFALRHVAGAVPLIDDSVARFRYDTPIAAYSSLPNGNRQPALLVAIRDQAGELTGLEITYLSPSGRRAQNLRINRKMIGENPANTAVHFLPPQPSMLVAEGFFTTLSACKLHGRPGWALLSIRNFPTWEPPAGVRDVLIAADRGRGEKPAAALKARLIAEGLTASVVVPPAPYGDWNDYDAALEEHACTRGLDDAFRRLAAAVPSLSTFAS